MPNAKAAIVHANSGSRESYEWDGWANRPDIAGAADNNLKPQLPYDIVWTCPGFVER